MPITFYSPAAAILSLLSTTSCTWHWIKDGTASFESSWGKNKELPQYKYLAIPVYKFVASKTNTVLATAISFFVTDLLMHQLLPQIGCCLINRIFPLSIPICSNFSDISWYPLISLGWLSVGAPVMYAKYLRFHSS